MTYDEALSYIHSLLKFGIHPGLVRMDILLEKLGNPHKGLKYVHVAGTNGKGSVSTAMSNILVTAGYRVGLYTSPFVVDFLERVQFNGQPVDKTLFAGAVSKVKSAVEEMNAEDMTVTEFEALTAAAFLCYQSLDCDIVVLEVGLGGRLDATNVIGTPEVNIITSLSLDHVAILGDTVEKIAAEKCGTVKENGNVVASYNQPEGAMKVIAETAEERHCTLTVPKPEEITVTETSVNGTGFIYCGESYFVTMPGNHQIINMTSVIEAAKILKNKGYAIEYRHICDGMKMTVLPARCEVLSQKPLIILDGGHNEDGAKSFFNMLKPELKDTGKLTVVAGMLADKAVETSLAPLMSVATRFVCVTPENPRAMKGEVLAEIAKRYCNEVTVSDNINASVEKIVPALGEDDILCVVGSLYLAGEVRTTLKNTADNRKRSKLNG